MLRKLTGKKLLAWTVIIMLAAIVAGYVLFCAFCILCGWIGDDLKLFGLGFGGINLPLVAVYIFGK